jgi:uncharacterized damage-inducible protein DinB
MNKLLLSQYEGVKGARHALFDYCAGMSREDLFKKVPVFNDNGISELLLHSANTYISWLGNFGLDAGMAFHNIRHVSSLNDIRLIYQQVDEVVADFLNKYAGNYLQSNTNYIAHKGITMTLTPLELFTHVITHEFHHKGQMLTMSRLLGYIPADTDVIRF